MKSKKQQNVMKWNPKHLYLNFHGPHIYGSFSLSHLLAFKPFLGSSFFPCKCVTEGFLELGRGGVCEKSGYKIFHTHIKFDFVCILPLPETIFEDKH